MNEQLEQLRTQLAMRIMNLPAKYEGEDVHGKNAAESIAYKMGHRDARHAAIDLVNELFAKSQPAEGE